jgi:diguanylate cyclase (GGDEF)-like protein
VTDAVERRPYVLVLTGSGAGTLVPLEPGVVIGRGPDVRLRAEGDGVSRHHARLDVDERGDAWLEDLGSRNGTFLNGRVVAHARAKIADGDRVQIGERLVLKISWHDRLGASFLYSMQEGALRDPLTGTFTRRYLLERLRGEISLAERTAAPLSVLVVGLDAPSSEQALERLARAVERDIRSEDVLARSGDNELTVLMRGVDAAGALSLAERMQARLARAGAIRIGVACGGADVLDRAQAAMLRAMAQGTDRIVRDVA